LPWAKPLRMSMRVLWPAYVTYRTWERERVGGDTENRGYRPYETQTSPQCGCIVVATCVHKCVCACVRGRVRVRVRVCAGVLEDVPPAPTHE